MEWFPSIAGGFFAAASVSTLLLLYFLKLKRREVLISSTLLWKRAVQDLQVNAPFQRLRKNILLLLQLLALAAVLFALARPILSLQAGPGRRYVLLIDRSASMNATDSGGKSRLAEARRQAKVLVESLRGASLFALREQGDQAMVLAFDGRAKVMCNFTADKGQLAAAIDAVEPTDGPSSLAEAIAVARAFAQSAGVEENNRSSTELAQLELFSDGRIADLGEISSGPRELRFHRVGSESANVAITAMQARRSYERPEEVHVFATVSNYGADAAACDVELSLDGDVRAVRRLDVPPTRPPADGQPEKIGQLSVSFVLRHAGGGVVAVRQLRKDALAGDDAAWAVLRPPRRLHVLLVSAGNAALEMALEACPLARLDRLAPEQFGKDLSASAAAAQYDVILLDGQAPEKLPPGRYIVFGAPPGDIDVRTTGRLEKPFVVDWRARHPVLQFVDLRNLYAAKGIRAVLPRDAAVLAEFGEGPAIALIRRRGSVFLWAAFDVMETNWPFQAGFVMFCYNATNFLGLETGREHEAHLRVGEAITVRAAGEAQAAVTRPGGGEAELTADPSGSFRYPRTDRAGVYSVAVPGQPTAHYAVNVLDPAESRIAPADELVLSAEAVKAESAAPRLTNQDLWPYLAILAMALVCLEWVIYNSKVRL